MGLTLGGNNSSFKNIRYLSESKSKMDKSLLRIASGKRILTAADDSGGLSVAMKLQNQINITNAAKDRVENAKSFAEMQDTAISSAYDIVSEMSKLMSDHSSGNADQKAAYAAQFKELQVQLNDFLSEKVNGVSLFSSDSATSKTIYTSAQGESGGSITMGNINLSGGLSISSTINLGSANSTATAVSISGITPGNLNTVLDKLSGLRAESGGDLSTLGFASDYLSNMSTNMESAHGRIMDVNLAEESANLARYSMQYEAAAAAVAQANVAMGAVLDLLLSSVKRD